MPIFVCEDGAGDGAGVWEGMVINLLTQIRDCRDSVLPLEAGYHESINKELRLSFENGLQSGEI